MTGLLAYATVVGVASAAYYGLSWAVLLVGTAVLTLISVLEQRRFRARLAQIGMTDVLHVTSMASAGNSFLAALAAYGLGAGTRFLFGG